MLGRLHSARDYRGTLRAVQIGTVPAIEAELRALRHGTPLASSRPPPVLLDAPDHVRRVLRCAARDRKVTLLRVEGRAT